jgi:hypothetical protein
MAAPQVAEVGDMPLDVKIGFHERKKGKTEDSSTVAETYLTKIL